MTITIVEHVIKDVKHILDTEELSKTIKSLKENEQLSITLTKNIIDKIRDCKAITVECKRDDNELDNESDSQEPIDLTEFFRFLEEEKKIVGVCVEKDVGNAKYNIRCIQKNLTQFYNLGVGEGEEREAEQFISNLKKHCPELKQESRQDFFVFLEKKNKEIIKLKELVEEYRKEKKINDADAGELPEFYSHGMLCELTDIYRSLYFLKETLKFSSPAIACKPPISTIDVLLKEIKEREVLKGEWIKKDYSPRNIYLYPKALPTLKYLFEGYPKLLECLDNTLKELKTIEKSPLLSFYNKLESVSSVVNTRLLATAYKRPSLEKDQLPDIMARNIAISGYRKEKCIKYCTDELGDSYGVFSSCKNSTQLIIALSQLGEEGYEIWLDQLFKYSLRNRVYTVEYNPDSRGISGLSHSILEQIKHINAKQKQHERPFPAEKLILSGNLIGLNPKDPKSYKPIIDFLIRNKTHLVLDVDSKSLFYCESPLFTRKVEIGAEKDDITTGLVVEILKNKDKIQGKISRKGLGKNDENSKYPWKDKAYLFKSILSISLLDGVQRYIQHGKKEIEIKQEEEEKVDNDINTDEETGWNKFIHQAVEDKKKNSSYQPYKPEMLSVVSAVNYQQQQQQQQQQQNMQNFHQNDAIVHRQDQVIQNIQHEVEPSDNDPLSNYFCRFYIETEYRTPGLIYDELWKGKLGNNLSTKDIMIKLWYDMVGAVIKDKKEKLHFTNSAIDYVSKKALSHLLYNLPKLICSGGLCEAIWPSGYSILELKSSGFTWPSWSCKNYQYLWSILKGWRYRRVLFYDPMSDASQNNRRVWKSNCLNAFPSVERQEKRHGFASQFIDFSAIEKHSCNIYSKKEEIAEFENKYSHDFVSIFNRAIDLKIRQTCFLKFINMQDNKAGPVVEKFFTKFNKLSAYVLSALADIWMDEGIHTLITFINSVEKLCSEMQSFMYHELLPSAGDYRQILEGGVQSHIHTLHQWSKERKSWKFLLWSNLVKNNIKDLKQYGFVFNAFQESIDAIVQMEIEMRGLKLDIKYFIKAITQNRLKFIGATDITCIVDRFLSIIKQSFNKQEQLDCLFDEGDGEITIDASNRGALFAKQQGYHLITSDMKIRSQCAEEEYKKWGEYDSCRDMKYCMVYKKSITVKIAQLDYLQSSVECRLFEDKLEEQTVESVRTDFYRQVGLSSSHFDFNVYRELAEKVEKSSLSDNAKKQLFLVLSVFSVGRFCGSYGDKKVRDLLDRCVLLFSSTKSAIFESYLKLFRDSRGLKCAVESGMDLFPFLDALSKHVSNRENISNYFNHFFKERNDEKIKSGILSIPFLVENKNAIPCEVLEGQYKDCPAVFYPFLMLCDYKKDDKMTALVTDVLSNHPQFKWCFKKLWPMLMLKKNARQISIAEINEYLDGLSNKKIKTVSDLKQDMLAHKEIKTVSDLKQDMLAHFFGVLCDREKGPILIKNIGKNAENTWSSFIDLVRHGGREVLGEDVALLQDKFCQGEEKRESLKKNLGQLKKIENTLKDGQPKQLLREYLRLAIVCDVVEKVKLSYINPEEQPGSAIIHFLEKDISADTEYEIINDTQQLLSELKEFKNETSVSRYMQYLCHYPDIRLQDLLSLFKALKTTNADREEFFKLLFSVNLSNQRLKQRFLCFSSLSGDDNSFLLEDGKCVRELLRVLIVNVDEETPVRACMDSLWGIQNKGVLKSVIETFWLSTPFDLLRASRLTSYIAGCGDEKAMFGFIKDYQKSENLEELVNTLKNAQLNKDDLGTLLSFLSKLRSKDVKVVDLQGLITVFKDLSQKNKLEQVKEVINNFKIFPPSVERLKKVLDKAAGGAEIDDAYVEIYHLDPYDHLKLEEKSIKQAVEKEDTFAKYFRVQPFDEKGKAIDELNRVGDGIIFNHKKLDLHERTYIKLCLLKLDQIAWTHPLHDQGKPAWLCSRDELIQVLHTSKVLYEQNDSGCEQAILSCIAVIREMIRRDLGLCLKHSQLLPLLLTALYPKNTLFGARCGQGKGVTGIALEILKKYLFNLEFNLMLSSSMDLVGRDKDIAQTCFNYMPEIQSAMIHSKTNKTYFDSNNMYWSTFSDMSFFESQLNIKGDALSGGKRGSSSVDEVDRVFLNFIPLVFASPVGENEAAANQWERIYPAVNHLVSEIMSQISGGKKESKLSNKKRDSILETMLILVKDAEFIGKFKKDLEVQLQWESDKDLFEEYKIDNPRLVNWILSSALVSTYREEEHFIIEKRLYTAPGENEKRIWAFPKLIDEHRITENKLGQGGQQCLISRLSEEKADLSFFCEPENIAVDIDMPLHYLQRLRSLNPNFIITGLTGTLPKCEEEEFIKHFIPDMHTTELPPAYPDQLEHEGFYIFKTEEEKKKRILERLQEEKDAKNTDGNAAYRPVLIFEKNYSFAKENAEELRKELYERKSCYEHVLDPVFKITPDWERDAGKNNTVSFATDANGRGADVKVSHENGLLVMCCNLSSFNDMMQKEGRPARWKDKGGILYLFSEEYIRAEIDENFKFTVDYARKNFEHFSYEEFLEKCSNLKAVFESRGLSLKNSLDEIKEENLEDKNSVDHQSLAAYICYGITRQIAINNLLKGYELYHIVHLNQRFSAQVLYYISYLKKQIQDLLPDQKELLPRKNHNPEWVEKLLFHKSILVEKIRKACRQNFSQVSVEILQKENKLNSLYEKNKKEAEKIFKEGCAEMRQTIFAHLEKTKNIGTEKKEDRRQEEKSKTPTCLKYFNEECGKEALVDQLFSDADKWARERCAIKKPDEKKEKEEKKHYIELKERNTPDQDLLENLDLATAYSTLFFGQSQYTDKDSEEFTYCLAQYIAVLFKNFLGEQKEKQHGLLMKGIKDEIQTWEDRHRTYLCRSAESEDKEEENDLDNKSIEEKKEDNLVEELSSIIAKKIINNFDLWLNSMEEKDEKIEKDQNDRVNLNLKKSRITLSVISKTKEFIGAFERYDFFKKEPIKGRQDIKQFVSKLTWQVEEKRNEIVKNYLNEIKEILNTINLTADLAGFVKACKTLEREIQILKKMQLEINSFDPLIEKVSNSLQLCFCRVITQQLEVNLLGEQIKFDFDEEQKNSQPIETLIDVVYTKVQESCNFFYQKNHRRYSNTLWGTRGVKFCLELPVNMERCAEVLDRLKPENEKVKAFEAFKKKYQETKVGYVVGVVSWIVAVSGLTSSAYFLGHFTALLTVFLVGVPWLLWPLCFFTSIGLCLFVCKIVTTCTTCTNSRDIEESPAIPKPEIFVVKSLEMTTQKETQEQSHLSLSAETGNFKTHFGNRL